jgi:hypothetical protein
MIASHTVARPFSCSSFCALPSRDSCCLAGSSEYSSHRDVKEISHYPVRPGVVRGEYRRITSILFSRS